MLKALTVWITTNCGKFLMKLEYLMCLLRNLYAGQEASVHGIMDWFKLGKEYVKIIYCHPVYVTSMQGTSCWAGKITSWNQDCQEKYQ